VTTVGRLSLKKMTVLFVLMITHHTQRVILRFFKTTLTLKQ